MTNRFGPTQAKFLGRVEYKGKRICGTKNTHRFRCVLPPGHVGPHDFRPTDNGGTS